MHLWGAVVRPERISDLLFGGWHQRGAAKGSGWRKVSFKKNYLFIFREQGREGEGEGDIIQLPLAHALPTDQPCNPGMRPD